MEKIDKLIFIKMKNFCPTKDNIESKKASYRLERCLQSMYLMKYSCRTFKELLQNNNKTQPNFILLIPFY